jgi:hypothetical protein
VSPLRSLRRGAGRAGGFQEVRAPLRAAAHRALHRGRYLRFRSRFFSSSGNGKHLARSFVVVTGGAAGPWEVPSHQGGSFH